MALNEFRVVILKAPSEEGIEQDPYVELLTNKGFSAIMIPTLQFQFQNLESLTDCLQHPDEYSGDFIIPGSFTVMSYPIFLLIKVQ